MAKKKKTVRKPFIQDTEPIDKEIATGESSRFDGLSLMAEISEIGKLGHEVAIQEFASGSEIPIEERLTGSWAQNVEDEELVINQGTFEASAKSHWSALVKVHTSYRGLKLTYMEPMIKNGIKIAQVLENGVIQFDRKPVIVRPWTTDLNTVKLVKSVPLLIRLHDLGLQYWGDNSLSALVSTIGNL
ncbi:hypothetical protein G4B88_000896 [Cannabis sativa]|uniref:Uncharacterized protein n=1 Tax=Cannabis sativa TaxID=3483 RepID=A0A7J6DUP9_CANSA|nr:hypothetical protein G4B88_000896 [Cannabis sativa]